MKIIELENTSLMDLRQRAKDLNVPGANRLKKEDLILRLEHGKPMVFGKNRDKCVVFNGFKPSVRQFTGNPPPEVQTGWLGQLFGKIKGMSAK